MEVFKTNKLLLTLLLIHPIDKDVKLAWKYLINFCGLFILCTEVISLIASVVHVIWYLKDLADILYMVFQITATIGTSATFIISVITRSKFEAVIKKVQDIYDSSKRLKLHFSIINFQNILILKIIFMQIQMKIPKNCWKRY